MADINIAELAQLGARIAELGLALSGIRDEQKVLADRAHEIEKELMPLITQHARCIAAITGQVTQAVPQPYQADASSQPPPGGVAPHTPPPGGAPDPMKVRVMQYLQRVEPGSSAADIAEQLHIDPQLVRDTMSDIKRGILKMPG
jgi:hypothetical protein